MLWSGLMDLYLLQFYLVALFFFFFFFIRAQIPQLAITVLDFTNSLSFEMFPVTQYWLRGAATCQKALPTAFQILKRDCFAF